MIRIAIITDLGSLEFDIELEVAPKASEHFLRHVREGLYDGAHFYRAMRKEHSTPERPFELVQGGLALDISRALPGPPPEGAALPHKKGVISLATGGTGQMTSEFFVCLKDCPELDKPQDLGSGILLPHSPFGIVASGMEVLHRIHQSKTSDKSDFELLRNQLIDPPIVIREVVEV